MSKYSSFKYSDQKYGASAPPAVAKMSWIVIVDWTNSGYFSGTNEAYYLKDLSVFRGRRYYIAPGGNGFQAQEIGTCKLLMDNTTRRFDPYNASGALYGNIKPGRKVKIRVVGLDGISYPVFTGWIVDIQPESDNSMVTIDIADGWHWLNQPVKLDRARTNVNLTDAMYEILLAGGYPAWMGNWTDTLFTDTQPVRVLSMRDKNAAGVLQGMADAGIGTFFFNRNAKPVYYPRNYASMTTHNMDQAQVHREIWQSQPWEAIQNDITVVAHRIVKKLLSVIWNVSDPIYVAAGGSVTVTASYEPAIDLSLSPLAAWSNINGTGTDLSGSFSLSGSVFSLSYTTFVVTNSSATNGYLTKLELSGCTLSDLPTDYTATDATSEGDFGLRRWRLDTEWLQSKAYADSFADTILAFLKDPHRRLIVRLRQQPALQYGPDLQDKVAFTSTALGIDETFTILGIEHRWVNDTGQDVESTLWLSAVISDSTSITAEPIDVEVGIPPGPGEEGGGGGGDDGGGGEEPPPEEPPPGGGGDKTAADTMVADADECRIADIDKDTPPWAAT